MLDSPFLLLDAKMSVEDLQFSDCVKSIHASILVSIGDSIPHSSP